ncbi:MAG: TIGR03619 family F420-dependent LLM class oxidoreductase [Acidimicrobiales bacterium]
MELGLLIFPTDITIDPVTLGKEAEARGFESLWFPEHSHIPVSRATPWGGREGAPPLPEEYWRSHEQFTALAAISSVTSTLKLATGITLLAQRDPIWTAKQAATLDHLSDGRLLFGVGYGWNKEELASHGVKYTERRARLRECALTLKALWTQEEASFSGDFITLEPSWAWPKPKSKPHPPIILGGTAGPKTAADIAEFCDGWMPIGARTLDKGWPSVVAACEAIDRDPATVELGVFAAQPDEAELDDLAEKGVKRAIFGLPQGPEAEVMAALDELTPLLQR